MSFLGGIKATLEKRKETKKAVEEVEGIKFERELEVEAQKVVEEYSVTLAIAKKYVLAQRRKKTIEENKEKRADVLKSIGTRIGEGLQNAEESRQEHEAGQESKKPKRKKADVSPIEFTPPSFLPDESDYIRGPYKGRKRKEEDIIFEPPTSW